MPQAAGPAPPSDEFAPPRPRGPRGTVNDVVPTPELAIGQAPAQPIRRDVAILEKIGPNVGCAAIAIGFVFCGLMFVWLYFNATTSRGNPVMGLVAGIVFTGLGLLGIYILVAGRRQKPSRDPRRLP
jgi:hypothetical protein